MMGLNLFGAGGDHSSILDPVVTPKNWGGLVELGGMLPPEEEELTEEEMSFLEKLGEMSGKADAYRKAMGIPYKDWSAAAEAPQAKDGMGSLIALMNATRQQKRAQRPKQDFRDFIMSPALKKMLGG